MRSPPSSPCINSRCAMSFRGIQRGVPFLWFHVRTKQRLSEARDTRSSARGAAATRHERVPLSILRSTGVSPVKEKREKGKVANRFFPFIVTFAHTPAWEKLFPFSFHRVLRVYRVNERILSRFNFSHRSVGNSFRPFFFPFFLFFSSPFLENLGFKEYWIFAIGLQREFRQIYLDPRFGIRRGYFWRR